MTSQACDGHLSELPEGLSGGSTFELGAINPFVPLGGGFGQLQFLFPK